MAVAFFIIVFPPFGSSLPQDSRLFQRERNAIAVRYHSWRIVGRRTDRRHSRALSVTARLADPLANARHLLAHGSAAAQSFCVEFDSYRVRIEVIEPELNLKYVLLTTGLSATSKGCAVSCMKLRARSNTEKAACPSFR